MEQENQRRRVTDAERQELAKKLDGELDDFIDSLAKKKLCEDRPRQDDWQGELEDHPFFMKKAPEPGQENPLYEGLAQLKYDPNENTPEELAVSYKEDGNYNFGLKKYRLAVLSYTEGIKVKCGNPEIEAVLLNNRSAANYFLKNYRSCTRDCELALRLKPGYGKVMVRLANCYYCLEQHQKCLELCDKILETNPADDEMLKLRQSCVRAGKIKERDARKKELVAKKASEEEKLLMETVRQRNINMLDGTDSLKVDYPNRLLAVGRNRVRLDVRGDLVWPVVFLYPEYDILDVIEGFSERDRLIDHLETVFKDPPEWDVEKKYSASNVNVYVEDPVHDDASPVDKNLTLRAIMALEKFLLRSGTPTFHVCAKSSAGRS